MTLHSTVDPERWKLIQTVFHEALDRPHVEREAYLANVCGGDPDLREQVASLLRAHSDEGPLGSFEGDPIDRDHSQFERLKDALAHRYRIERPLGVGGMATVYLAFDVRHERAVAIKALRPELSATVGGERFLREIRIAAGLRHPNILPLYDSDHVDGILFYVMPAEGETLRHRLRRDSVLPAQTAITIAREVLDALHYAHSEGVVHRDIKPENILLCRGHAVVADFGIARAVGPVGGSEKHLTRAGVPIGTPAYMSPEQLVGDPNVDARSDIYSVGCVLYEMLVGNPPEPTWRTGGPNLTSLPSQTPLEVARALRTALTSDRKARFATASAFADTIAPAGGWTSETSIATSEASVAVLPFSNLSGDAENEYLSDGITEEVINALTHVPGLRVAARTSSFALRGADDVHAIGVKLHVGAVLEGSVRRAGNRLRISVQLIDVTTGYHLWSERFDREMDDVFAIQDEIAQAIAERLRLTLSDPLAAGQPLVRPPTRDLAAYQLYLKGRHLWSARTKPGLLQSVSFFQRAIGRDARYAAAYSGLADTYLLLRAYGYMPSDEALTNARTAAERALALDETLAEAHTSRGQILRASFDWAGEESSYRRALELNPNYATAHHWYATLLAALGRFDEAIREIRKAEELDPLSHAIGVTVANVLFLARDYEAALEQLHRTLQLEPNFASTHAWLGIVYAQREQYQFAEEAVRRAAELNPDNPNVFSGLAYAHARRGRRDDAVAILERGRAKGPLGWESFVYSVLGEHDTALDSLEQALEGDSTWNALYFIKVFPWLDPIRTHPRYRQLLRRLNFPETGPGSSTG